MAIPLGLRVFADRLVYDPTLGGKITKDDGTIVPMDTETLEFVRQVPSKK
jgi:hypothetical protein